jgi:hypothetical protein
MGAFTRLFSRLRITSDPNVSTQTSAVIVADTTNANLVIAPNGTGALVANVPDGTTAGGNARGNNAVDLQTSRGIVTQVASGTSSVIVGGSSNTASANHTVVGGQSNTASSTGSVIFGRSNSSQGDDGVVFGNGNTVGSACSQSGVLSGNANTVSSARSVICGGQTNTASTNTHATVVGGQSNTSSGQYSVSGGVSNTASGFKSTAFGNSNSVSGNTATAIGYNNTVSGLSAFASGGYNTSSGTSSVCLGDNNTASNTYSFSVGNYSDSYLYQQNSFASSIFANLGDAQQSFLTARRQATLTTGGTTVLSLDGTGVTNLIIPKGVNGRMWNVQVRWVAVVTTITGTATGVTVGDTKTSTDLLAVAKRGGVTTVSAHTSAGTHAIETIAGSLTAANIAYTAGASQEMAITFTGPTFAGGGSVTMRVVAAISLTEVAY